MSALNIDTLAASQTLRKRGFTEDQATGVVEILREIDASALATKEDIRGVNSGIRDVRTELHENVRELRADIRDVKAEITTTTANLKVEILRWVIVTQIALAGLILAAIKFVR